MEKKTWRLNAKTILNGTGEKHLIMYILLIFSSFRMLSTLLSWQRNMLVVYIRSENKFALWYFALVQNISYHLGMASVESA